MAQQNHIHAPEALSAYRSESYLKRNCPCCGTNPPEVAEVETAIQANGLNFEDLTFQWNGFFKEKAIFSYARCQTCGLLYAPRYFTLEQLTNLYAQMPPNMDQVPLSALRRTQQGYFNSLKRHSSLSGDFLEMGPDIGLFTENCVREGQFERYWLLEPNRSVERALRKVVEGNEHKIVHEMPGFSQIPKVSISAAVIIHVLDHLIDPVDTLRQLRLTLKQDATVIIVTHDESSLLRKLTGSRWPAFCLQHPQIYSPASMRQLLSKAGFDVVEQSKTVNYFEVKFLLKHLLWTLGIRVGKVPNFGNAVLGLKLGNMLTVARPAFNTEKICSVSSF